MKHHCHLHLSSLNRESNKTKCCTPNLCRPNIMYIIKSPLDEVAARYISSVIANRTHPSHIDSLLRGDNVRHFVTRVHMSYNYYLRAPLRILLAHFSCLLTSVPLPIHPYLPDIPLASVLIKHRTSCQQLKHRRHCE